MDIAHDILQLLVHLFRRPVVAHRVLAHLQRRYRHAARVHRLRRRHDHSLLPQQEFQRLVCGRHVRYLDVVAHACLHDLPGILQVDLVLRRAGHHHVHRSAPGLLARVKLHAEFLRVVLYPIPPAVAHFQQIVDLFLCRNPLRIVHITVRAGNGHHLAAQLRDLRHRAPAYVAKARQREGLACKVVPFMPEHLRHIVYRAKARGLRTHEAAAIGQALARQHAVFICIANPLILSEQIADLLAAYAQVARRHVHVRPNMPVQLRHEGLAEMHDLRVRAAARIEVRAAFASADGQARQAVFKGLLKAQKLHHGQVHRGMEAQSSLIRPDRAVELHPVAPVYVHLPRVVLPHDPELDHPFRLHHPLQQRHFFVLRMPIHHRLQRRQHLFHRLQKLRLVRVLFPGLFQYPLDISVHVCLL